MKELRKFQRSTFDTLTRQKFIEDQHYFGIIRKITRIANEVNCMNDSKTFRMLHRHAVEIHTSPVNRDYSPNILSLKDC